MGRKSRKKEIRRLRGLVLLFFIGSGMASLALEVTWTRILGTVFGNTVFAASTVLTAFMLGLALGSAVLGRIVDRVRRPLLLYGALEVGVALYAFAFPLLSDATDLAYGWFYRAASPGFALLSAVRFGLSLVLLLPPTFLMGGTLPILSRHLGVRCREPGREVGYLYAANTLGAVAGCFVAGFILLKVLGVRGTLFAAGGLALTIGVLAVVLGRRMPLPTVSAGEGKEPRVKAAEGESLLAAFEFRLVVVAFAIAGFCSLAYEVLWTRVLIFALDVTVYSFATMLTTFLAGLAVGSFLSARFLVPRIRRPLLCFGAIEVLVGLSALVSVPLLGHLWAVDLKLLQFLGTVGSQRMLMVRFLDAFVILFVPTVLMGAAFPIVLTSCLRGKAPLGKRVGQVYAANTIGCVLGAFCAGFILLPLLGTHGSLLALVVVNFAVGIVLVWRAAGRSLPARLGFATPLAAVAVVAFAITPADVFHNTINLVHHPSKLLFAREHPTGTVTIHEFPNEDRLIAVDGVNVAGFSFMLRSTQKLQGYIPLCLHPNPRRVVQIGFGGGETARVGLDFGVDEWTVVEICPAVFEAGEYFESVNHGSYRDPRIRKIIMDGKNFALLSDEKFDIVMNDSIFPGSSGSSALYTVDHFRNCRARLAEGGLVSCWVPLDLRPHELRMILRSFQEVFPHTSFWVASNCLNKHALILGSLGPLRIDYAHVAKVMGRPNVAADLKSIEIHNAYDLLDCFVCDEAAIRKLCRADPVNSDNRPRLAYSCAVPKSWELSLAEVLKAIVNHHTPVVPYVVNFVDEERDRAELTRRFEASDYILLAQVAELQRMAKERKQMLELALKANPGEVHVASCQAEMRKDIEDLRQGLQMFPGKRALRFRLADKLYMWAHQPHRDLDMKAYLEAADLYEEIVSTRPPPPAGAFVRLASIRFRLKQPDVAERILRECLTLWPRSAATHDMLAGVYLRKGKREPARHHIEEALRIAPGNVIYESHRQEILRILAASP